MKIIRSSSSAAAAAISNGANRTDFANSPCQSSLIVSRINTTQCPHSANKRKFLLVGQHWIVHTLESMYFPDYVFVYREEIERITDQQRQG